MRVSSLTARGIEGLGVKPLNRVECRLVTIKNQLGQQDIVAKVL